MSVGSLANFFKIGKMGIYQPENYREPVNMPAEILSITLQALRAEFETLIDRVSADDHKLLEEVLCASRSFYEDLSNASETGGTNVDSKLLYELEQNSFEEYLRARRHELITSLQ